MSRISLLFLSLVLVCEVGSSQSVERVDTSILIFDERNDSTVYSAMQQFITANYPISYLSPLALKYWPVERVKPLLFGEGKNGYILEGNVDLRLNIAQGRGHSNHFWKTGRVSFIYNPSFRMTLDNSSNFVPTSQKVGLMIDKILWDSYTGLKVLDSKGETLGYSRKNWVREHQPFKMLYLNLVGMHYSNGSTEGVYNDFDLRRNDYQKGDFSTNLLGVNFTYVYFNNDFLSANLGYQHDGNWFGPFSFIDSQLNRYGKDRLVGYFQFISRAKSHPLGLDIEYTDVSNENRSYLLKRMWEYRVRFEWEYIMGNLDEFKRSKDYRFNWHLYLQGQPLRSRSIGYLIHFYSGRDFLNIRYDDIVFGAMAGLTFSIKKYQNPWFDPRVSIIRGIPETEFERRQNAKRLKSR